ncbi:hypothetical protein EXM90_11480 [Clostridium botulinum]|uniref:hypothetical protein n=1 Tax=Clostridium botulinum TaxID=1491 RepID=UPI00077330B2|nr:hypothetical protein [Clostridium botulinum]AUN01428.1 hypothetical protein RSJ19_00155 [Clostridium botulinum]MBN3367233.1 hypothetical protein [Clostridium botulinum]MBN3371617.1 hypothetical protein [Clostridium botulinum]MBN3376439.1 hypothetical protein [Clostridium botulinum]MBN3384234.1 hypothetical protein [Clostridium botulinum]
MLTLKINYQNGDFTVTKFNGNFKNAKEYYLNNKFNIGTIEDNIQTCTSIKVLSAIIGGKKIEEGQKYRHKESGCIWSVNTNYIGNLVFDSGIIQREIKESRINKLEIVQKGGNKNVC